MDWKAQSMTALRAQDGSFTSSSFQMPTAFLKNQTPEGQLVGILSHPEYAPSFAAAFFNGQYSVAVTWEGLPAELTYYVGQPVPSDVRSKFLTCMGTL